MLAKRRKPKLVGTHGRKAVLGGIAEGPDSPVGGTKTGMGVSGVGSIRHELKCINKESYPYTVLVLQIVGLFSKQIKIKT